MTDMPETTRMPGLVATPALRRRLRELGRLVHTLEGEARSYRQLLEVAHEFRQRAHGRIGALEEQIAHGRLEALALADPATYAAPLRKAREEIASLTAQIAESDSEAAAVRDQLAELTTVLGSHAQRLDEALTVTGIARDELGIGFGERTRARGTVLV